MAELKTVKNKGNVGEYLNKISNPEKKLECSELINLLKNCTGNEPVMWGDSIVGFGEYHYKYGSGREGDWFLTGVSSRKEYISVYLIPGFEPSAEEIRKLGKVKTGKSCINIKRLKDINTDVLAGIIKRSLEEKNQ